MFDSLFKKISRLYLVKTLKDEYDHPPFPTFNERPIEYRFVFEQIQDFYPKTVLDVGTGTTSLPNLMANCGCKVTAIDNVKDYWASDIFNRHYYVMNDDITATKLTGRFDMITCVSTLEHIAKYDDAVRTMLSLLNPGGRLVLTFPYNDKRFVRNVYELPGSSAQQGLAYKTAAFSRKDLDRWCAAGGAQIEKQEFWRFYDGEYWTVGTRLSVPERSSRDAQHQISCVVLGKT